MTTRIENEKLTRIRSSRGRADEQGVAAPRPRHGPELEAGGERPHGAQAVRAVRASPPCSAGIRIHPSRSRLGLLRRDVGGAIARNGFQIHFGEFHIHRYESPRSNHHPALTAKGVSVSLPNMAGMLAPRAPLGLRGGAHACLQLGAVSWTRSSNSLFVGSASSIPNSCQLLVFDPGRHLCPQFYVEFEAI